MIRYIINFYRNWGEDNPATWGIENYGIPVPTEVSFEIVANLLSILVDFEKRFGVKIMMKC